MIFCSCFFSRGKPKAALFISAFIAVLYSANTHAEQNIVEKEAALMPASSGIYEEMFVTGGKEHLTSLSGAAALVDEMSINEFIDVDLNAILSRVPGVYLRQEDGYGLRPNINLRGTSSDRSTKITLMEDGILIGPAPYSAPAAYYFPNVARMHALEVFKGPAAIQYGPHTVGGAINFVSRPVPEARTGQLELAAGNDGFHRGRLFYGDDGDHVAYWIDALRYGSDGFKELDGGGDTGFVRNDFNTQWLWRFDGAKVYQELALKLGYADERADETYLGLTDDDFALNPNRRYVASQLDHFDSEHRQIHLIHTAAFSDRFKLTTRAYHNEFERAWNKLDGIIVSANPDDPLLNINDVLSNPTFYASELDLLRGEDSAPLTDQRLDVTNNDREYQSSGIETRFSWQKENGNWQHNWDFGLRFHRDSVERDHHQRGYLMQAMQMVFDGDESRRKKALNEGQSDALAIFISDQISHGKWRWDLGLRYEYIEAQFTEAAPTKEIDLVDTFDAVMPGLGVFYQLSEQVSLLAGINKGFSPKAASKNLLTTDSEESVNYEAGLRYQSTNANLNLIGFLSDYDSLIGRCRASEPCAGLEVNSGESQVYGLEFAWQRSWWLPGDFNLPLSFVYTYSQSEFTESFESSFDQWGNVAAGDELPYLPEHQGRIQLGLERPVWSAQLAVIHTGEMRDTAGSGPLLPGEYMKALTTLDLALQYELGSDLTLKLVGENISNKQEIVSRRPFGSRPNQGRAFKLGLTLSF